MKKLILSFAALLSAVTALRAQQDFYDKLTVVGDDVHYSGANAVYKVKIIANRYQLSNVFNLMDDDAKMTLLDGKPAPELSNVIDVVRVGDFDVKATLQEVFTPTEIAALKSESVLFSLHCIIDSSGYISEIRFLFPNKPAAYSIPPDKWYELEQKIKQRLTYTMSPKAKSCTFVNSMILLSFRHIFK